MSQYTFTNAPSIRASRSMFDLSHTLYTSMSAGRLYPVLVQEVYPGDQFNIKQSGVIRTSVPFRKPIMDNIFVSVQYYFVPYRLICDEWEDCITGGNGNPSEWVTPEETDIPTQKTTLSVPEKTVMDYLGYVPGKSATGLTVLPARAFAKIWNDWFRDENVDQPVNIITHGTSGVEAPNNAEWSASNYTGMCPPVSKKHDYFTSSLRGTQKGDAVGIPLQLGQLPLTTGETYSISPNTFGFGTTGDTSGSNTLNLFLGGANSTGLRDLRGIASPVSGTAHGINLSNVYADGDRTSAMLTVNDLRFVFAIQRILERSARGGSRYTEYVHQAYNINTPDARLQRSEFISGTCYPLNIQQVAQTTQSQNNNSLADLAAYSLTNNNSRMGKAFVEHGYLFGVSFFRQFHTYQQGIAKFLTRHKRYDFYDPSLQSIGEQPVYKGELFRNGDTQGDIFGYQEAWAELRQCPNRVTGQMRSSASDSFDVYHLADNYANAPTLSSAFIHETRTYIDRALGLTSTGTNTDPDQFLIDFHFDIKAIRCLPTYSVPSLIDHH